MTKEAKASLEQLTAKASLEGAVIGGNVTINDTDGNNLYSVPAGATQVISDSTVTNTDGDTLASILAQGTFELADTQVTEVDGSTTTVPAGDPVACDANLCPPTPTLLEQIDDSTTSEVVTAIEDSNKACEVFSNGGVYNSPGVTGEETSYRSGDDGDLQAGRGSDWLTLDCNNINGNTNRFETYDADVV
jgi:hypothetical protein